MRYLHTMLRVSDLDKTHVFFLWRHGNAGSEADGE